jgi:hypothetical protein
VAVVVVNIVAAG